jgi:hypothetical protein
VEVSFGSVKSTRVIAIAADKLYVETPAVELLTAAGKPLQAAVVDITLRNLANDGTPIIGEEVISADAYTYRRIDLSGDNESLFSAVVRKYIRLWKSQVLDNTILERNMDYDDDPSDPFIHVAKLPAIALIGPDLTENRFHTTNEPVITDNGLESGVGIIRRRARYYDMGFDIIGLADNEVEFLNLMHACTEFMDRNTSFNLPCPAGGVFPVDHVFTSAFRVEKQLGEAARGNVKLFRGKVVIRAVPVVGFTGEENDKGIGFTADVAVDQVTLQSSSQIGDNLPEADSQPRRGPGSYPSNLETP